MAKCETVQIKADNKQGFIVINKSDFDDKKDKLVAKKTSKK